jgi:hypothetical protein
MSLKQLVDILNKQKLIGSMVQNQNMQKHEVIESLVQKQHSVELQNYIARVLDNKKQCLVYIKTLNGWKQGSRSN